MHNSQPMIGLHWPQWGRCLDLMTSYVWGLTLTQMESKMLFASACRTFDFNLWKFSQFRKLCFTRLSEKINTNFMQTMWPVTSGLQKSHRGWAFCRHNLYTKLNGEKHKIFSWRLHCTIFINFWYKERGTSQDLVSCCFYNSWIYVEIITQNDKLQVQYLACRKGPGMYEVTLWENKVSLVYMYLTWSSGQIPWGEGVGEGSGKELMDLYLWYPMSSNPNPTRCDFRWGETCSDSCHHTLLGLLIIYFKWLKTERW